MGQKRYHVLSLENGKIHLEEGQALPRWYKTALKVAFYAFVIPVLMALIVCAYYRSFHLEPIWKEPSVEETIARLRAAQEKGLRLALFMGREAEQSIPQEEGWVWCSLNNAKLQRPLAKDRLHLSIDFNSTDITNSPYAKIGDQRVSEAKKNRSFAFRMTKPIAEGAMDEEEDRFFKAAASLWSPIFA